MKKIEKAAETIIHECMNVCKKDSVLVITDKCLKEIGVILFRAALPFAKKTKVVEIPIVKRNGMEPPKDIAKEMLSYSVILIATSKSISHTKARRNANKAGARIASMPGITKDMMERCIVLDYEKLKKLTKKVSEKLDKANKARITTKKGTDITMSLKGRKCIFAYGVLDKKINFDNLPSGEAGLGPVEGSSNGVIICDASIGGIGKVDKPVKIIVKDGFAVKITGGKAAKKFYDVLKDVKDKNAFGAAELGIGTNWKARITGKVLEDEKVLGTCHIAFGNNKSYGGKLDVPVHIDCVIKTPTIFLDNKKIMQNGKLLI